MITITMTINFVLKRENCSDDNLHSSIKINITPRENGVII